MNEVKNQEYYKLAVISDKPDTQVFLNDKNLGKATVKLQLPEGNYKIKLSKEGYNDFIQEIALKKDTLVSGVMTEKLYTIEINSNVTSKVFINDEEKGTTPFITQLKGSEYKIKLKSEGYLNSEKIIEVNKNETIVINLSKVKCDVSIYSNSKDTSIFIDNELKGTTPLTVNLDKKSYIIEAKFDNLNKIKQIEVCKDKAIHFEFEKKKEPKKEVVKEIKDDIKDEVKDEIDETNDEKTTSETKDFENEVVKDDEIENKSANLNGLKYFNIEFDASYKHLHFDNSEIKNIFIAKGYLTLLLYKLNKFTFDLGGIGYGLGNDEFKEFSFHLLGVKYTIANVELSGNISFLFGKYFAIGNGENAVMNLGGVKLAYVKNINKINLKPYISLNYGISANKYEDEEQDKKGFIFGLGFAIDFEL